MTFLPILLLGCPGTHGVGVDVELTATFPQFEGAVPKNLLILSIDTTRRDVFTRYGSPEEYAPFMASLADEGVALDRHRSCSSWTMPSMLCVTTGRSNVEMGYVPDLRRGEEIWVPDMPTLASRLSGEGYTTVLTTSNSWFSDEYNTDYGFDFTERPSDASTTGVFAAGRDKLRQVTTPDAPWYLHLHVKEPHAAYNPPEEYLGALAALGALPWDLANRDEHYALRDMYNELSKEEQAILKSALLIRYHGEVSYLDDLVRAAFAEYEDAGLLDDTLVLLVNDHGEQFWEHGEQTHAFDLNFEENDGFAIFWSKNIVPGNWIEPTSHYDLAPTAMSLLGFSDSDFTGYPVGEAPPDRAIHSIVAARNGVAQSVVQGSHKLHYHWRDAKKQLYNLVTDPKETDNLYSAEDPDAVALWDLLLPEVEAATPLLPNDTPLSPGP